MLNLKVMKKGIFPFKKFSNPQKSFISTTTTRTYTKQRFVKQESLNKKFSTQPRAMDSFKDLKDSNLFRPNAFIDNEWYSGTSNAKFDVTDPGSEEIIASVPDLNSSDAHKAIESAHEAFINSDWSQSTSRYRHDVLHKLYNAMVEHEEDLAKIITRENGKPFKEALGEVRYAAGFVEWFAEEASRAYGDVIPSNSKNVRYLVIRQPVGVAAIITPWNFPIAMITRKVAAALAAGCTVVIKPASETPLSALAFAELAQRVGIPKGVINIVTTNSHTKEIGEAFCKSPLVSKISFTGSTAIGKILMAGASSTVKKVSLELGGNAPFIVFDDADINAAVEGLVGGKFRNAGQTCVCPNRVYVQKGVHDEFVDKLISRVSELKVGLGFDQGVDIGPLIHDKGRKKVIDQVEDALSKGAKIRLGGNAIDPNNGKGAFYPPTILTGMTKEMTTAKEETFGPLIPVFSFETESEALRLANDTPFGLAAYAYTKDLGRAFRVSEVLQSGMVAINSGSVSTNCAPFGGVKESGIGREGSKYGLDDYSELKFVSLTL